jgi:selenocysteine-specific elongation factor
MGPQATRSPLSVAVIGHVNHGKTALVRALTGMETDRLAEEKARGLSITLGYAWRDYPAGTVDFLDAPGHEDFIRAMVMGTTGAQAALLVVSATEGFGRQTREHLRVA